MKLDLDKLRQCLNALAREMNMVPLPNDESIVLLNHVLFDGLYSEQHGKCGWKSYEDKLITDVELVNLVIAHAVTKISNQNSKCEPSSERCLTTGIRRSFEIALLIRKPASMLLC